MLKYTPIFHYFIHLLVYCKTMRPWNYNYLTPVPANHITWVKYNTAEMGVYLLQSWHSRWILLQSPFTCSGPEPSLRGAQTLTQPGADAEPRGACSGFSSRCRAVIQLARCAHAPHRCYYGIQTHGELLSNASHSADFLEESWPQKWPVLEYFGR